MIVVHSLQTPLLTLGLCCTWYHRDVTLLLYFHCFNCDADNFRTTKSRLQTSERGKA